MGPTPEARDALMNAVAVLVGMGPPAATVPTLRRWLHELTAVPDMPVTPKAAPPPPAQRPPPPPVPAKADPARPGLLGGEKTNGANGGSGERGWMQLRQEVRAAMARRHLDLTGLAKTIGRSANTTRIAMQRRAPPSAPVLALLRRFLAEAEAAAASGGPAELPEPAMPPRAAAAPATARPAPAPEVAGAAGTFRHDGNGSAAASAV